MEQLTSRQRKIVNIVARYPGQFSRSGLAKMLVGAKSWPAEGWAEYGSFTGYGRKALTGDIDILIQQGYLYLDSANCLYAVK